MAGGTITTFIGVQYLRDNSIINDNVDAKVLEPIIRMAQDKYIQQILGTGLYTDLLNKIDNVLITPISTDDTTLIEQYIIPTLVQYTVYESIPFMTFKFRNKGINTQNSDNSQPSDVSQLSYVRDNVLPTAQFYAERTSKYLCSNSSLYSSYTTNNDIYPDKQNFFNGIHIPKYRRSDMWNYRGNDYNNIW